MLSQSRAGTKRDSEPVKKRDRWEEKRGKELKKSKGKVGTGVRGERRL